MGEDRAKHFNSKHEDAVWRGFFARWHAGERADRLRAEAGASHDTWTAAAKRLGMRRKDLPPGHPGRRAAPAFAERADGYRHPKSLLTEGQWRDLFRQRAAGTPDTVLVLRFGVAAATICSQARARGIRRADLRALAEGAGLEAEAEGGDRAPPPPCGPPPHPERWGGDDRDPLGGVRIDPRDAEATRAAFEAVIVEAGMRADFAAIDQRCRAKLAVERALFASGRSDAPPHPSVTDPVGGGHPLHEGEGEAVVLRPAQTPPEGAWRTWLFMGGRGAGKTLAGASWLADMSERCGRLALVGPTLHDVREVMIGGASGVMGLDRWVRAGAWPIYAPSRRRLVFPNGAEAHVFSAEDPDSLRGPQFAAAWADEYAAWGARAEETLAMLRLGLRLPLLGVANARLAEPRCLSDEGVANVRAAGAHCLSDKEDGAGGASVSPPRLCITTTPRPTAAMRRLRAEAGLVETRAATAENARWLAPGFVEGLEALYGGTRRAAQELEGQVVEAQGALFTAAMMEAARGLLPPPCGEGRRGAAEPGWGRATTKRGSSDPTLSSLRADCPPHKGEGESVPRRFDRVVVAVDPTASAGGCACGIVVVGRSRLRGNDNASIAWVLDDRSAAGLSPQGWAERAVRAADDWGAAAIVAETNQGGDMVQAVLAAAGAGNRYRPVRATVGKRARAEPVAALYEQGRVRHAGRFEALEEELMALGAADAQGPNDRADALVWAVTELLLARRGEGPRLSVLGVEASPWGLSA
jgi:phage terminase large subunit-like protein